MPESIPTHAQTLTFARAWLTSSNLDTKALDALTIDSDGNVDTTRVTDAEFATCVRILRDLQCSMLADHIAMSTRRERFSGLLRESVPELYLETSLRAFGAGIVLTETWLKRCRPDIAYEGYEYDYDLPATRCESASKHIEFDASARSGRANMASEKTLPGSSHYAQPKAADLGDDGLQLWRYLLTWRCTGRTPAAIKGTQAVVSKSMSEWAVKDIEYIMPELQKLIEYVGSQRIELVGSIEKPPIIQQRLQTSFWKSYTNEELIDTLRATSKLIESVKYSLTIRGQAPIRAQAQAQSDQINQSDDEYSSVVPIRVEDGMRFPVAYVSLRDLDLPSTSLMDHNWSE